MAFVPFGYAFELISTVSVAEARASLRERRLGWFDPKRGPRGWIVGPIFCLWLSAFDRRGPMAFGLFTEHARGTRVRGRAGSDLNGVLMFTLLIPLVTFLVYRMILDGSVYPRQLLVIGAVFLVGGPWVYWSAHKDRRQAEPLIRFIEGALGRTRPKVMRQPGNSLAPSPPIRLHVCESGQKGSKATADAVRAAIEAIRYDPNGFLVLERDEQRFMQTAAKDGGFILERREGSETTHFIATRLGGAGDRFSADEIEETLLGYLQGGIETPGILWEPLYP